MHPGCRIDQVYLCRDPVDFRKSIDGLSALVEQELKLDPFGSALYVFVNRQRNKIKVLYWHRNGFCLWLKRLEAEKFAWPRAAEGAIQTAASSPFGWRPRPHAATRLSPPPDALATGRNHCDASTRP